MKVFGTLCKKAKTVLCGAFGVLAVACVAFGFSVMPKTVASAETTDPIESLAPMSEGMTYTATAVEYGVYGSSNRYGAGTNATPFVQAQGRSTTTPYFSYYPSGNNVGVANVAMGWEAPEAGVASLAPFKLTINRGNRADFSVNLAIVRATLEDGVMTVKESVLKSGATAENHVTVEPNLGFFKTFEAETTSMPYVSSEVVNVEKGDLILFVIDQPKSATMESASDWTIYGNPMSISFTQTGAEAATEYKADGLDIPTLAEFNAGAEDLRTLAKKNFHFYGIEDGVWEAQEPQRFIQAGDMPVSTRSYQRGEFVESIISNGQAYVNQTNLDGSKRELLVYGGPTALGTRVYDHNAAVVHRVAEAGLVTINNVYFRGRYTTLAAGVEVVWKHVDNGAVEYYSLSEGVQTVSGAISKEYTLSNLSFNANVGDEIIFRASKLYVEELPEGVTTTGACEVLLDVDMTVAGVDYVLDQTSARIYNQGEHGFYYGVYSDVTAVQTFEMKDGAAIRLVTDPKNSGIRFTARMHKDNYNTLVASYDDIEFGVVMMPKDYLDTAMLVADNLFGENNVYSLTQEEGKKQILGARDTQMYDFADEDADYVYLKLSMVNVKQQNYKREFVATCYIKVTRGTTVTYNFIGVSNGNVGTAEDKAKFSVRSVKTVAQNMLDAGALEAGSWGETLLKQYVAD